MEDFHVNWLAVAAASITPMIVGMIWYHPKVMGTVWMKATGLKEEDMRAGNMGMIYGAALVLAFMLALFLMLNVTGFGQEDVQFHTFKHGLGHGLMLTLLFVLPLFGTNALFEKRGWNWLLVNVGYWWVTLSIALGILSAWR
ncbi:MAG: DUF1761 domain-containing protein [Lewinellaceae bacterium]|nr:DUF1761 domain-containing protein [Lewinellaceae bacterium]